MANTYVQIASVTVGGGGAASMAFSSIVGTYTDLVVKISSRADADVVDVICSVNGSALDSGKRLRGNGVNAASTSTAQNFGVNNSGATASTFSNAEWYFPNYAGSNNKSVSMDGVTENNGTDAYASLVAGLESTASAITALSFAPSSGNFVQYSTATLYGISKS
jgi:hypothetical protein